MSKAKKNSIDDQGTAITVVSNDTGDVISLTDMARKFGVDGHSDLTATQQAGKTPP
jgi:hypothetical protein